MVVSNECKKIMCVKVSYTDTDTHRYILNNYLRKIIKLKWKIYNW